MRVRVKICGITRPEDAVQAALLGADAIGLVFYPASPRAVTVTAAAQIVAALPAFVSVTALFVNAEHTTVTRVLSELGIDMLQFHGDEEAAFCRSFNKPYIKAVPMREDADLTIMCKKYHDARALLVDTFSPHMPGGTGNVFDWSRIPTRLSKPIILAGGLHAGNVAAAIDRVKPYAVDVSGGVEKDKGIKDAAKMAQFIQEVNRVASQI